MLTYTFEKTNGVSLYEQLYRHIKSDILSGTLAAGEKLPSKRALAAHLEVSVITVKNAYEQLMAEGYLTGVEKKGYFVSSVLPPLPSQPPPVTQDAPEPGPADAAPPSQEAGDSSESDGDRSEVDAFDALVDGWMEARPAGVSIEDVEDFRKALARVPDESRDECLHRALNLIPDENALLLAGVLLDKSFGKDVLETVFNDILNRDEQVKLPLLKSIHKDRAHPCWADAAWILDVTGESEHKPTD